MNSPRDLRRRIRSIHSTAQITRAMQMVAASKMRKAQDAAVATRPFVRLLYQIQRKVTTRPIEFTHPLLETREVRRRAVILVGADKGLCGALNANLFRLAVPVRPGDDGVHHGGPEGVGVRRRHGAAARRRLPLRRHAAVRGGTGRGLVRPRPVREEGSGRGGCRRHPVRQHDDPGGGPSRVPPDRRDQEHADPGHGRGSGRSPPTSPSRCSNRAPTR